jgi:hypothetical protein
MSYSWQLMSWLQECLLVKAWLTVSSAEASLAAIAALAFCNISIQERP